MICGFKTGPRSWEEGKKLVADEGAKMCEVWFRVDKHQEYEKYLKWLIKNNITTGLHHWAACKNGIKNNLSTHHSAVRDESIAQMKKSIDIGSEYGCVYVNIHPGARNLEKVILTPWKSELLPGAEPTDKEEADRLMIDAAIELDAYAKKRGITFLIETLSGAECIVGGDRSNVYRPGNSSLDLMRNLVANDISITNDLVHTVAAHEYQGPPSKKDMWQVLIDFTKETALATKLLHINTLLPPYNGTDSHDGITVDDFKEGVFPNEDQIMEILSLFKERDDVYLVPEPKQDMKLNHLALKKMVAAL